MGRQHADVAAFSGFAAQANLIRFGNAGASALYTINFSHNPVGIWSAEV